MNTSSNEIVFKKSSVIRCDIEKLFDFHLNCHNVKKITPNPSEIIFIDGPERLGKNSKIHIVVKKFFIKQVWEVEVKEFMYPNVFIDVASKSPFKEFMHEHRFILNDSGIEMIDFITLKLPLFMIPLKWFILREFDKMFSYRHLKIKDIFENDHIFNSPY